MASYYIIQPQRRRGKGWSSSAFPIKNMMVKHEELRDSNMSDREMIGAGVTIFV